MLRDCFGKGALPLDDEKTVEKDARLGCGKDFAGLEFGICGTQDSPKEQPTDLVAT